MRSARGSGLFADSLIPIQRPAKTGRRIFFLKGFLPVRQFAGVDDRLAWLLREIGLLHHVDAVLANRAVDVLAKSRLHLFGRQPRLDVHLGPLPTNRSEEFADVVACLPTTPLPGDRI